jgi:hypothetical protein
MFGTYTANVPNFQWRTFGGRPSLREIGSHLYHGPQAEIHRSEETSADSTESQQAILPTTTGDQQVAAEEKPNATREETLRKLVPINISQSVRQSLQ